MIKSFELEEDSLVLIVNFSSNERYEYYLIPPQIFKELREITTDSSKSVGKWFTTTIKGKFDYKKLRSGDKKGKQ